MSKKELVEAWYTLKINERDFRNASGIRTCINEFVKKQGGLEIITGGTLVISDSSPGSYPYGSPDGETAYVPISIYHLNDCTLKVFGNSTRENNLSNFQIEIFGEQEDVQELTRELDKLLTDSTVRKYEKK